MRSASPLERESLMQTTKPASRASWRLQAEKVGRELKRKVQSSRGTARDVHRRALAQLGHAVGQSLLDESQRLSGQGDWEAALKAAQEAVRVAHGLDPVDEQARQSVLALGVNSHLRRSHVRYILQGNSETLREELRQACKQHPQSHELAEEATRFHVMAGRLTQAREVLQPLLDASRIQPRFEALKALVLPAAANSAEQAYPCNYYSYRYELSSDDAIEAMLAQVYILKTWDPSKMWDPQSTTQQQTEILQYIQSTATAAGDAASAAALASASAQDQDSALDDLQGALDYDGGDSEGVEGGRKIFRKPARRLNARPGISALQRQQGARAAAQKAAEQAAQTVSKQLKDEVDVADNLLAALTSWNAGIRELRHQNYSGAVLYLLDCRTSITRYFAGRYPSGQYQVPGTELGVYTTLCLVAKDLYGAVSGRRVAQAGNVLRESYWPERAKIVELGTGVGGLQRYDWIVPAQPFILGQGRLVNPMTDALDLLTMLSAARTQKWNCELYEQKVDAPLLTLGLVHVSLALAEARRFKRDYDAALSDCKKLERRNREFGLLSQAIELPFVAILKAQILLEKGDDRYKRKELASHAGRNGVLWNKFQGLKAANSYMGVLDTLASGAIAQGSDYWQRLDQGVQDYTQRLDTLSANQLHPLAVGGNSTRSTMLDRQDLKRLVDRVPIKGVELRANSKANDGNVQAYPLESVLDFDKGSQATNPVVYGLMAQAKARLVQIEGGLNYLGYLDDFVPPWRFSFLLQTARNFADHAKSAERDYLNFLSNAEQEQQRETSARQAVVTAKGGVDAAASRVIRATIDVDGAAATLEVARQVQSDTYLRWSGFETFDNFMATVADDATRYQAMRSWMTLFPAATSGASSWGGTYASIQKATRKPGAPEAPNTSSGSTKGEAASSGGSGWVALAGMVVQTGLSIWSTANSNTLENFQRDAQSQQRELEKSTLAAAAEEAKKSAQVATQQLASAKAAALSSALEWANDLMTHELSKQNYEYLLRRQLNSEQWFRLAHAVRCLAERHLRYAVEVAFLAQLAYQFETNRRTSVIRFDYDCSEDGSTLAGDFLLADLDALEHDLIINQRDKEQHAKYIVSLARDYPDSLGQLQRQGSTIFTLTLERLERRFPGLYNVRVGSVDVLPVALMDPTRMSVLLTHTGAGQLRTSQPVDTAASGTAQNYLASWAPQCDATWPVKLQIGQVETVVFSGLTRGDQQSSFSFAMNAHRGAFERLPAAAPWHISMSMKENQVLPGSLADVLISFELSADHDPALQAGIEQAIPTRDVLTRWISVAQSFPDGFYDFNQSGQVTLPITRNLVAMTGRIQNLRNFGLMLVPSSDEPIFNAMTATAALEFEVTDTGVVSVVTPTPVVTLQRTGLTLVANVAMPGLTSANWHFGDDTDPVAQASATHTYRQAGRYTVTVGVAFSGRLLEYTVAVVVSNQHPVSLPLTLSIQTPVASVGGTIPAGQIGIKVAATLPPGEDASLTWQLDNQAPDSAGNFVVAPGRHVLIATAARALKARIYSRQRWKPDVSIKIDGLSVSTNRLFDANGQPTNVAGYNELATHLFGPGPLGPLDRWTIQFPLADNPQLASVDYTDAGLLTRLSETDLLAVFELDTNPADI